MLKSFLQRGNKVPLILEEVVKSWRSMQKVFQKGLETLTKLRGRQKSMNSEQVSPGPHILPKEKVCPMQLSHFNFMDIIAFTHGLCTLVRVMCECYYVQKVEVRKWHRADFFLREHVWPWGDLFRPWPYQGTGCYLYVWPWGDLLGHTWTTLPIKVKRPYIGVLTLHFQLLQKMSQTLVKILSAKGEWGHFNTCKSWEKLDSDAEKCRKRAWNANQIRWETEDVQVASLCSE